MDKDNRRAWEHMPMTLDRRNPPRNALPPDSQSVLLSSARHEVAQTHRPPSRPTLCEPATHSIDCDLRSALGSDGGMDSVVGQRGKRFGIGYRIGRGRRGGGGGGGYR